MTQLLSDHFINDKTVLDQAEIASVIYHNLFDYPLNMRDLVKWRAGKRAYFSPQEVGKSEGFYYIGSRALIYKRLMREKVFKGKMLIAKRAVRFIKLVPSVKLVGITGALAMKNAAIDSDIDLIIITSKNTLWTTRGIILLLLKLVGVPVRRYKVNEEKDKLCLNMWLDETALGWKGERNVFTAHELAQIIPLFDSGGIYCKLKQENEWVIDYWPSAWGKARRGEQLKQRGGLLTFFFRILNYPLMQLQYLYMKNKITKEVVTLHKALFHPVDWSEVVNTQLGSYSF
jgi:predicted nucleotidyltransferase